MSVQILCPFVDTVVHFFVVESYEFFIFLEINTLPDIWFDWRISTEEDPLNFKMTKDTRIWEEDFVAFWIMLHLSGSVCVCVCDLK